ncbi:hypothetical protein [Pseudolysobacter antarcticus]|nr:hypothetical protein [Pseudolysobacter antarcticus]
MQIDIPQTGQNQNLNFTPRSSARTCSVTVPKILNGTTKRAIAEKH